MWLSAVYLEQAITSVTTPCVSTPLTSAISILYQSNNDPFNLSGISLLCVFCSPRMPRKGSDSASTHTRGKKKSRAVGQWLHQRLCAKFRGKPSTTIRIQYLYCLPTYFQRMFYVYYPQTGSDQFVRISYMTNTIYIGRIYTHPQKKTQMCGLSLKSLR